MPKRVQSGKHRRVAILVAAALIVASVVPALADCAPEPQGEGRVAAAEDARTLRLDGGTVLRLAGLAPLRGDAEQAARETLARTAIGRLVSLHGDDDMHDRYGRQRAFVFAEGEASSLQEMLMAAGHGLRDPAITEPSCRAALESAENAARNARLGLWAAAQTIKNAERPDDISGEIGHFTLIGGRVHSVRESGGWTYLNFGRRWRDGFAAMVPKGAVAAFDKAGKPLKGFEGQNVQVRGFVQKRGGPRIEMAGPEQIEVVGGNARATAGTRD